MSCLLPLFVSSSEFFYRIEVRLAGPKCPRKPVVNRHAAYPQLLGHFDRRDIVINTEATQGYTWVFDAGLFVGIHQTHAVTVGHAYSSSVHALSTESKSFLVAAGVAAFLLSRLTGSAVSSGSSALAVALVGAGSALPAVSA